VGTVVAGSQNAAGTGDRLMVADTDDPSQVMSVKFDGAASEETLADGATVVLTGDLTEDGKFSATDIALQG
jgi:cytochrome c-type biogenesis protein CcmE